MGMSLYDLLVNKASNKEKNQITKQKFGDVMHDPNATEAEVQAALDALSDAGGYDNLPED